MCEDWLFASVGLPVNGSSDIADYFSPQITSYIYTHGMEYVPCVVCIYIFSLLADSLRT